MQFLLQAGSKMMPLVREVLKYWNDFQRSGVVLSARALSGPKDAQQCAANLKGCCFLFDPCFYEPKSAVEKLYEYPYWTGTTFSTFDFTGPQGKRFCQNVINYQVETLKTTAILLPGRFIDLKDNQWLKMHRGFAEQAAAMRLDRPVYATIALGTDVILNQSSLDEILNHVIQFPVDGVYFVYQPPAEEFLPKNVRFYGQLLSAFLSLSVADKDIILGYANQSSLVFAAAGVETITSGNWRNTRAFAIQNFRENSDGSSNGPRPKNWYYDGNSLCEFLPETIERGYTNYGLRDSFGPETKYMTGLLHADRPSEYLLTQKQSFAHYLTMLRTQWMQFATNDPNYRIIEVDDFLQSRQQYVESYRERGFQIGRYSSYECLQAMRSALNIFLTKEEQRIDWLDARPSFLRPRAIAFGA
jgi:hypothetical protein